MLDLYMVLICLAAVFLYPFAVLRPILRVFRKHPNPNSKSRFSMTDLLALMFVFQFPIVFANLTGETGSTDAIIFVSILMVVSVFVWLAGVMAANHLGVKNQWKRIVVIGFTFPTAIVGAFALPLALGGAFQMMSGTDPTMAESFFPIGFFVITFALYRSSNWVVQDCALIKQDEPAVESMPPNGRRSGYEKKDESEVVSDSHPSV